MKLDQLKPELRKRIQDQIDHEDRVNRKIPNPITQCNQTTALGGSVQGKEKGDDRITVRFVGCRVRPLDPDNFAGSVKDLLDGLRHAKLIPGDEPWKIILETEQIRVQKFGEEITQVFIYDSSREK